MRHKHSGPQCSRAWREAVAGRDGLVLRGAVSGSPTGKARYPQAGRLLICAGGGSNGYRVRAWKTGLAKLAAATGLEITVCHLPLGTSKFVL